jgi:uncharacterized membrane protein
MPDTPRILPVDVCIDFIISMVYAEPVRRRVIIARYQGEIEECVSRKSFLRVVRVVECQETRVTGLTSLRRPLCPRISML